MLEFVQTNKLPFLAVYTTIKPDGGKFYDGVYDEYQKKNYKDALEFYLNPNRYNIELPTSKGSYIRQSKKDNQLLIINNDKFVIFDTDTQECYDKLVEKLKELYLYDEKNITKSFKGKINDYGRHFWFLADNKDENFINNVPSKTQSKDDKKGIDIFYKNALIGENIDSYIDSKELELIDYETYKIILNEFDIKIEEKNIKTNENNIKTNKINDENNDDLDLYINAGLKHNIFKKFGGWDEWMNVCYIIANIKKDEGEELFHKISQQFGSNDYEKKECSKVYKGVVKKGFSDDKLPLKVATLIKYYQDKDIDLYNIIKSEVNEIKKINNKNFTFPIDKLDTFDTDYFNTLLSYDIKKKYFEKFVVKVLRPEPLYIYSENDNNNKIWNGLLYNEKLIRSTFTHLKSGIITNKKESKFIDEWINDPNIKIYNNMDFMPYNGYKKINNTKTFNLFNGYNRDIELQITDINKDKILIPFTELLFETVGADKKSYDYFINFLAHLIQKPSERIPIIFIIKSKQGVGKNVLLDCIGNLIGKHHYITSSDPDNFFGEHAEGFYRKLLINMNECEGKDTFDYEGKIKSFISEDTITFNPKYIRQTTINNYARLIITTNKSNPVPIDVRSKDRRFVVFQSTEKYLDNKYGHTFWTSLTEHFKKPEFVKSLYDFLNNIDISNVNWKKDRPITQAYINMCKQYIPIEALFLEDYIDKLQFGSKKLYEVSTTEFYSNYVLYCKENGFINDKNYQININRFTTRLEELELNIIKVKTAKMNVFKFTPKDSYDIMIKKNWIAKYNNDDEPIIEEIQEFDFTDYFAY